MVLAQGCLLLNNIKVLSWSLGEVIDPLQHHFSTASVAQARVGKKKPPEARQRRLASLRSYLSS